MISSGCKSSIHRGEKIAAYRKVFLVISGGGFQIAYLLTVVRDPSRLEAVGEAGGSPHKSQVHVRAGSGSIRRQLQLRVRGHGVVAIPGADSIWPVQPECPQKYRSY